MAKTGSTKRSEKRRLPGMMLELEDEDRAKLQALVTRYQKIIGGSFKSTKAFVIRTLIRHAASTKTLPPIQE